MRADILKDGTLRLTPITATEESMAVIWFADKSKNTKQIKDIVVLDSYEDMGPACIKSIEETAGQVENLTAGAKKELRKKLKEELDLLNVEYNGRASTEVLQTILEKVKEQRSKEPETPKKPSATVPPESSAKAGKKSKTASDKKEPVKDSAPTKDTIREALKKYAATNGRTAAIKLLADYDALEVSDLKEESYAAFINAAQVD